MAGCDKILVYGSLLTGFTHHERLLASHVLSSTKARVKGSLFHLVEKGYPALVDGNGWVYGELLEVDDICRVLPALDAYEEYVAEDPSNEYMRILSAVYIQDDELWKESQAYVYWYARQDLNAFGNAAVHVPGGDWKSVASN